METSKKTRQMAMIVFWLSSFIFTSDIYSQVTIGSGEPPRRTSLLQLKDQEPDAKNVTSKTGGFLLPRVELRNQKTLEPFLSLTDPDYSEQSKGSVGLLVYNVADITDLPPGVYYWDGEKWTNLANETEGSKEDPNDPDPEIEDMNDPEALKLPNSYIMKSGSVLHISVMKGYGTWKQIMELEESQLQGALTVELLWQTKKGLIEKVSFVDGDQGPESKIRIEANDTDGNAIIAARLNNEILWSWHIWVTDYDPKEEKGQRQNGNYVFMDRNLGALNLERGSIITNGMLYQWGRKDPFPGSRSISEGLERDIFNINNEPVDISKVLVTETYNLSNALRNPTTFYYHEYGDWLSTNYSYINNNLWSKEDGTKGVFDPCPKGWRIPNKEAWKELPENGSEYLTDSGLDWDKEEYNAGFYPNAGNRDAVTGNLAVIKDGNVFGKVWTSDANGVHKTSFRLAYYRTRISSPTGGSASPKAQGNSVRCIKDIQ